MERASLIRLGGLAAIVGGIVYAGVGLIEERLAEYLYYMANIGGGFIAVLMPLGAMAAIAALHALHSERYGLLGALASLAALVGLALAIGALTVGVISPSPDLDRLLQALIIGLLVATVGILLLGLLSVDTGMLPWWGGVALVAGSPVGVFLTMIPSAASGGTLPLWGAFQALGGVPWIVVGYAIFRAAGRVSEQPSRVR
jgi:hypothetical protein